jgi:hypothetical protein
MRALKRKQQKERLMTKFRVLKRSYIQDGIKEVGDIVDIDPSTVNPEDENLEPYKEPKAAKEPAPPVEPAPAPVAAKPTPPAPTKDEDDKKVPAKLDVSTPPAVLVSPDGKETPIPKPAPDKPASGKP